jgi:hypothetical protein
VGVRLVDPGDPAPDSAGALARAPTASLVDRLASAEAAAFQGRSAEARRVWELLSAAERLPRVLCVQGPPGIGKTAFLYALARGCETRGYPAVILDSRDFPHQPEVLSEVIAERCGDRWRDADGLPLLLALDTYEEMQDIEAPLWNDVLPGLKGPVLVVLSGRRSAPPGESRSWSSVVEVLELGELSPAQARRLIRHHGVSESQPIDLIAGFAAGNPLLLTVCAQHARSQGRWEPSITGEVARSLIAPMTREIVDLDTRALLDAASLVRTFNQELLAEMTGRDVSGSFNALCSLSVVRVVSLGARLHDLVRESVAAELRWRSPNTWQTMRRRAHSYLGRLATASPDRGAWAQELVHLAASTSPGARFYASSDHPDVHVREACVEDLPRLNELCRIGVTRFGLPASERARQLNADFEAALGSCMVAVNESGTITGFAYTLPLSAATWRAAAKTRDAFFASLPADEMTDIKKAPGSAPAAGFDTGATHLPAHEHVNPPLRAALFAAGRERHPHTFDTGFVAYHLLTSDCPELPELAAAGLSQRRTGIRLDDCVVDEWVLRIGPRGVVGWTAKAVGAEPIRPYAQQLPERELTAQLKTALEHIDELHTLQQNPLTNLLQVRDEPDRGAALRTCLLNAIGELADSPTLADQQAAALLLDYYVHRIGSMELVADKLRLPRTTFYRRLQRGLTRTAQQLRAGELTRS